MYVGVGVIVCECGMGMYVCVSVFVHTPAGRTCLNLMDKFGVLW